MSAVLSPILTAPIKDIFLGNFPYYSRYRDSNMDIKEYRIIEGIIFTMSEEVTIIYPGPTITKVLVHRLWFMNNANTILADWIVGNENVYIKGYQPIDHPISPKESFNNGEYGEVHMRWIPAKYTDPLEQNPKIIDEIHKLDGLLSKMIILLEVDSTNPTLHCINPNSD